MYSAPWQNKQHAVSEGLFDYRVAMTVSVQKQQDVTENQRNGLTQNCVLAWKQHSM